MSSRLGRFGSYRTALVAGGAGFLGSFLCERLIDDGFRVVCLDNFRTGSADNLARLRRTPRFSLITADVSAPLPKKLRADRVYNLACPASPRHYQADPVHTLMTSVIGARNLLEVATASGGRMLQASTSEVYGDPDQHPQTEKYWGNVNPIGIRACYVYEPLPSDDPQMRRPDIGLAGKLLGWSPTTSVRQGVARTIKWFVSAIEADADVPAVLAASSSALTLPAAAVAQEAD
jgi:nucleoside-diphosphate-sugar epimerase